MFFGCSLFIGYGIAGNRVTDCIPGTSHARPCAFYASAWNIPNHMLSGAIAYPVLSQENPETVEKVKAVLQKHPWYANQWQAKLQDAPVANHDMVLFMQAARWAEHTPSALSFLEHTRMPAVAVPQILALTDLDCWGSRSQNTSLRTGGSRFCWEEPGCCGQLH